MLIGAGMISFALFGAFDYFLTMKVNLAYGQGHLTVDLPDDRATVIEPSHNPGLPDERSAVIGALQKPISARPIRELIKSTDRVCIAFTDLTRPTPMSASAQASSSRTSLPGLAAARKGSCPVAPD